MSQNGVLFYPLKFSAWNQKNTIHIGIYLVFVCFKTGVPVDAPSPCGSVKNRPKIEAQTGVRNRPEMQAQSVNFGHHIPGISQPSFPPINYLTYIYVIYLYIFVL
jgi:hypothetical protein